jgi:hypothetical protein
VALRLLVFADRVQGPDPPNTASRAVLAPGPRTALDEAHRDYEAAIDALIPEAEHRADIATGAIKKGRDNVNQAFWSRMFHRAMDEAAREKRLRCLTWQEDPERD